MTEEAKLIDERFTDVHHIFKALGAQLLENAIGRYDAILCNICGILFFPQNPEKKCPLCSLVKWLANQGRIASGESSPELKADMKEELEPHPLFKDWAED